MHGYCYTTDRPTGVMGGSWRGLRVYICTCTCTCTVHRRKREVTRGEKAAGCELRGALEPLLQLATHPLADMGRGMP